MDVFKKQFGVPGTCENPDSVPVSHDIWPTYILLRIRVAPVSWLSLILSSCVCFSLVLCLKLIQEKKKKTYMKVVENADSQAQP